MKKYNIGDKVVITGRRHHYHDFETGIQGVINGSESDSQYYVKAESKYSGLLTTNLVHCLDFQPAPKDRIPASDGHEGETFYRFNHTEGNSI